MQLATALLACLAALARAATLNGTRTGSPVSKLVPLIVELRDEVEQDGRMEQKSFDKYQCWCEDTLGRKAADISKNKEDIAKFEEEMKELNGEIGAHGAEIKNLKKLIAANLASQQEATEIREKESGEYNDEKVESEQCIGALESAIKILTGAGTAGGFLESGVKDAQLLGAVSEVRRVLQRNLPWRTTPAQDLEVIRRFVAHPDALLQRKSPLSAAQTGQNPFGDYAPQSTRIQGILRGMYDGFAASLEKANVEEATKQKAFEEFIQTKTNELNALKTDLQKQETDKAAKDKKLAETTQLRDDTVQELKANEAFFADTKQSCRDKANAWSKRSELRTMELLGINQAIQILTSKKAQEIFLNASSAFVQLGSVKMHRAPGDRSKRAYSTLSALAAKYKSIGLAQIAAEMKSEGHFDKVLIMIDHLVAQIRKEEAFDIAHRDRCQNAVTKNKNDLEDLQSLQAKTAAEIQRLQDLERETNSALASLEEAMATTKGKMEDRLNMRNEEVRNFERGVQDDTNAIALLQQAMVALKEFYRKNKIPLALAQRHRADPEYTIDPDKAPEVAWEDEPRQIVLPDKEGGGYQGRKAESKDIIAILAMLVEDLEHEIKISRKDDATAQENYLTDNKAMTEMLHAQKESYAATKVDLAEIQAKITAHEEFHEQTGDELQDEQKLQSTIYTDCSWVETHFDTRRAQRKAELAGLAEAKSILAGAAKGDFDEAVVASAR